MDITVSQVQGKVPVTVLSTAGDLDGSNYQDLIAAARQAYQTGARHVVVDLSRTPYLSSAGLVALHSIALLMRGAELPGPESGWNAYHAITRDQADSESSQPHVKLLNLQPKIQRTLEMTGMDTFFEIYSDLAAAVASF
ncbi:MAG TPA: STAS domain-containing protein [Anaerolineae bacterium]